MLPADLCVKALVQVSGRPPGSHLSAGSRLPTQRSRTGGDGWNRLLLAPQNLVLLAPIPLKLKAQDHQTVTWSISDFVLQLHAFFITFIGVAPTPCR